MYCVLQYIKYYNKSEAAYNYLQLNQNPYHNPITEA